MLFRLFLLKGTKVATVFDLFILVVAVILAVMGGKRGFIREIFRFIALAGGFFGAFLYYRDLQFFLRPVSSNFQVTATLAFILLFIVIMLIILGIGWLIRKFTHLTLLGWIDRLLGVVLGLLKTAIIAWVACLSIAALPAKKVHEEFGRSYVYKSYSQLPRGLSRSGMEKTRTNIRGILNFKSSPQVKKAASALEEFREKVDSAKISTTGGKE